MRTYAKQLFTGLAAGGLILLLASCNNHTTVPGTKTVVATAARSLEDTPAVGDSRGAAKVALYQAMYARQWG